MSKILQFSRQLRKNQTPAESFFWGKVRNRQLFGKKFSRQYVIQHSEILGKKQFFIADFYCHEKKLIVEIDGGIYKEQLEYDRIREDILLQMGYMVVRFENETVLNDWDSVESHLRECLE